MNENDAIDLGLKLYSKHILPARNYGDYQVVPDERELVVIQVIADLYKAGYEICAKFKPNISLGDLEKMAGDEVIY